MNSFLCCFFNLGAGLMSDITLAFSLDHFKASAINSLSKDGLDPIIVSGTLCLCIGEVFLIPGENPVFTFYKDPVLVLDGDDLLNQDDDQEDDNEN